MTASTVEFFATPKGFLAETAPVAPPEEVLPAEAQDASSPPSGNRTPAANAPFRKARRSMELGVMAAIAPSGMVRCSYCGRSSCGPADASGVPVLERVFVLVTAGDVRGDVEGRGGA